MTSREGYVTWNDEKERVDAYKKTASNIDSYDLVHGDRFSVAGLVWIETLLVLSQIFLSGHRLVLATIHLLEHLRPCQRGRGKL